MLNSNKEHILNKKVARLLLFWAVLTEKLMIWLIILKLLNPIIRNIIYTFFNLSI